jgi:chromosomal replication initiator protein
MRNLPVFALDARFTFENFVVGKPNAFAHAAARRVAEGGPVTFNPLFLYSSVGLGKTHLMHAIAWEAQARNPRSCAFSTSRQSSSCIASCRLCAKSR